MKDNILLLESVFRNQKHIFLVIVNILLLFILIFSIYNLSQIKIEGKTGLYSETYYVGSNGNDENIGSQTFPFKTIQKALSVSYAGDTINLAPGEYFEDVKTVRDGTKGSPITITGPVLVVIKGNGANRIFEVNHSYIILNGFTIDGLFGDPNTTDGYRDKLLYVLGKEQRSGVNGLKVKNMTIKNAGGECIRFRYFAQNNEIADNHILNCGMHDFKFNTGKKNGEGIYVGTAPEQRKDGKNPTTDVDESNNNWIHNNIIDTNGNECVDIKEGATNNMVEYNKCTGQKDTESGGMDSRGNGNTFRFNDIYNNLGAGVRLGGDTNKDGINNNVYKNNITNNKNGGIKFQRTPQGKICGNVMTNNNSNSVGKYKSSFNPSSSCSPLINYLNKIAERFQSP